MQNKTPNKRKSLAGNAAENSPGQKMLKTPKTPKDNKPKTPKKSPGQTPEKQSPAQGNKRKSLPAVAQNGNASPPKKQKIAPFPGTGAASPAKSLNGVTGAVESKENRAKRRRGRLSSRRELTKNKVEETVTKLKSGDSETVKKIQDQIDALKSRKDMSKTAERKLRKLKGLLLKAGLIEPQAQNVAKKAGKPKQDKKTNVKATAAQKKKPQPAKKPAQEDEEDSEESDYDAESQIKPDKIAKNMNDESDDDESDEDDDDDSAEEESDDDDSPKKVLPKKQDKKALGLHNTFVKGRKVNVQYTQGGKKKGDEAKKDIKSKNLKLQAMRKKGQLAGGVNESQKRSLRRGKQAAA